MSDRPTPETDALDCELHTPRVLQDRYSEMRDHAQKLERERDEALEKIKQQKLEIVRLNGATNHAGGTPLKIALRERDEAREAFKIVYNERVQMELERNEWKNKAYSHATDYTLMEAKCFRLEQQLKEYDQLKS